MGVFQDKLKSDYGVNWSDTFVRRACYYSKIDCIEYISKDEIAISDRIDEYLTLIWDESCSELIGFKLKGFRYAFNTYIKPIAGIIDGDINIIMVTALEHFFTELGDELFPEKEKRQEAYRNVIRFIKKESITMEEEDYQAMEEEALAA